jgi:hypothetical protein
MLEEMRPFELLKLIRDGIVTNVRDLRGIPHSLFYASRPPTRCLAKTRLDQANGRRWHSSY